MPGLAAIAYPSLFQSEKTVDCMLKTVEHRGNLEKDSFRYKNLELGITGGKITSNERQSIFAMLDGTIYNTKELVKEIKASGHHCEETSTMSSLIISAYELWGYDFIPKLNGSFAIIIFDQDKHRLVLIRDRIGKKPLYWSHNNNYLIASSELKGILCTGIIPQTPAIEALSTYLFLGYLPRDITLIRDVNKLLPGYFLQYTLDGKLSIHSYWSLSSYFVDNTEEPEEEIIEHLDHLLTDAVKIRTPKKSNVSCFLGGGAGSATIAHYLSKTTNPDLITNHSSGFQKVNYENIERSRDLSKLMNIPFEVSLLQKKDLLNDLVKMIWYLDEPIADPHIAITWQLCRMASVKSGFAFSGMGSDELLGGHTRYASKAKVATFSSALNCLPDFSIRNFLFPLLKLFHSKSAYNILRHMHVSADKLHFLKENSVFNTKMISSISPPLSQYFNPLIFIHKFHQFTLLTPNITSFLYFDTKTTLADKFLPQYERFTTAHHLQWATPFLDHRIIEYLSGIPTTSKFHQGTISIPLKGLMQGIFPESFLQKEKQRRKNYLSSWVDESSFQNVLKWIENGVLAETGLIIPKKLSQLVTNRRQSKNRFQQLWAILILEIWFRLFIHSPVSSISDDTSLNSFMSKPVLSKTLFPSIYNP